MQHALGIVQAWCESVRLSVNPDKVNMILFITTYKAKPIRGVQLGGKPVKLVNEAKYLRVTLDSKLNWGKHISNICEMAINTWACRRAFGNTWDLSPGNVRWMCEAIIRPRAMHGALVWWQRCALKTHQSFLNKIQRLAIWGITGSPSTTPLAALELI